MNSSEKLLIGILTVIIGWIITNVILFFLKRYRLKCAIIADIQHHLMGAKEAKVFLFNYFEKNIKEGHNINYPTVFTRSEYELYNSIQKELIDYFGKKNLLKIIKIYSCLWESEAWLVGLTNVFVKWSTENRKLSSEDINFLRDRKDRIIKLLDIITEKKINKLKDLREDYRGHPG